MFEVVTSDNDLRSAYPSVAGFSKLCGMRAIKNSFFSYVLPFSLNPQRSKFFRSVDPIRARPTFKFRTVSDFDSENISLTSGV